MRTTRALALPVLGLAIACAVALVACGSSSKSGCEASRDLYLAYAEEKVQYTLETFRPDEAAERAELEKNARAELATARERFVAQCKSADEATRACLARIDELAAAEKRRNEEITACPTNDTGLPDEACQDRAREKANAEIGACDDKITAFADALYD